MNTKQGLYFEEIALNQEFITSGRTITETDVVNFAGISGDYTQLHTDVEYARESPFGQRIAHGLLILSIASGLTVQMRFLEGTIIAFRELTWKFSKPVFIGDTIRVKVVATEKKKMRRLGGGLVMFDLSVTNQKDELVQKGVWRVLIAAKPE